MKSKLSAIKFVRNNKKQVWVMIISLSMTFMTMYVINFLFLANGESFKAVFIEQPKKAAVFDLTLETMGIERSGFETQEELSDYVQETRSRIAEKLKEHAGIYEVYYTQCLCASYSGIAGEANFDFPLLEVEQIPDYMAHMGAKLIEGDMPENPGEILVDKKIMKNGKMKIGDYFQEDLFGKLFKVSGVVESDCMVCVGTPQGYANSGWYFVVLCDEKNSDMTKVLADIGIKVTENDSIYDAVNERALYDENIIETINAVSLGILLMVMIFLAISIVVAYISFMRSRVNEYCLYSSIGYSRKDIYEMMMKELGLIFGISILFGGIITIVLVLLFANILLDSLGLLYRYFYPEVLLRIIVAYLAVIGVLQIPILVTISRIKTIDMIED